jgi:hypothetical protein
MFYDKGMKRTLIHNQKGMGLMELMLWAGFIALIGYAAWQMYSNPDNLKSRGVSHNAYEDTHP